MRKFILAAAALLSLTSAACAAFAIFQTYSVLAVPQITCDMGTGIASVGGPCASPPATCNGDVQSATRTVTMVASPAPANKNLNVSVNTFSSGDVGKTIRVPGAAGGAGTLVTTISAFVDAQNVTLALPAVTAVSGVSTDLIYGMDDSPAFAQFNVWALANQGSNNQVVQAFAASGNCWFGTQQGGGAIKWVAGIKNLVVEGYGTTLNGLTIGWYAGDATANTGSSICHKGIAESTGCTARIDTVSAGSSQVVLTSTSFGAGYLSRFSATPEATGNWILIAQLNPQAITNPNGSGYPPNPVSFEWRQISSIDGGTGTITLTTPLTNSYLSTWPNYSSGNAGESDAGGPATIYAMGANWNTRVEYKNLTMQTVGQLNGSGRFVTYRNVSFDGSVPQGPTNNCGAIPSQNEIFAAYNTDWTYCTIETDKITTNMVLDTINANRVDFQSSSIINLTMTGSTIPNSMFGTAQNNIITDTSIGTFRPGSNSYGNTNKVVCTRCDVTTFEGTGGIIQNNSPTLYSMSGGVISFLNADVTGAGPPSRIFAPIPGNVFYNVGGSFAGTIGLFNAQTLMQDATNTYVQTNEAGGFPTFSGFAGVLRTHPAPQFTCDDCAGDATFVAMNTQLGAIPLAPLGEFSSRSYTPTVQTNNIGTLIARGRIVSLTIDVTTASTSSGSPVLQPTGQAHNETVKQSDWTAYDWIPIINLKQAGTRVITPSGTTCNGVPGACAGDTCSLPASGCYSLPEAVWIKENLQPGVFGTFNGTNPQFTITIQTDQGVVP